MIATRNNLSIKDAETAYGMPSGEAVEPSVEVGIDHDSKQIAIGIQNAACYNIMCNGCKVARDALSKAIADQKGGGMHQWDNYAERNGATVYKAMLDEIVREPMRIAKRLPVAERQEAAKDLLVKFGEQYSEYCAAKGRLIAAPYIYDKSSKIYYRFYRFEKALENGDYLLAIHELEGVLHFLPPNHRLVYNNIKRAFDKYLNTNLKNEAINMIYEKLCKSSDADARHYFKTIIGTIKDVERLAEDSIDETLAVYDFYITFLREEFRIITLGRFVHDRFEDNIDLATLFPYNYRIDGESCTGELLPYAGSPIQIKDTCLLSYVWKETSIPDAYTDVSNNGFDFNESDCTCIYYPEANICAVTEGFHHAAIASLLHMGEITPQKICSLKQFYPYVRTDGAYWIDANTGANIGVVYDFRIAAIYELCRRKDEISHMQRAK
jgi:hypothetical protein